MEYEIDTDNIRRKMHKVLNVSAITPQAPVRREELMQIAVSDGANYADAERLADEEMSKFSAEMKAGTRAGVWPNIDPKDF